MTDVFVSEAVARGLRLAMVADAPAMTPMPGGGGIQPGAPPSWLAPDLDRVAASLDASAGCEFVDDRIRLLE